MKQNQYLFLLFALIVLTGCGGTQKKLTEYGAQGSLCGMDSEFIKKVFEAIHEESVRQQMEIINK